MLAPSPDCVLVDAFRIPDLLMAQRAVVHGDSRCSAIAAASIVAKVTRDRMMHELHSRDPRYGFDKHKGYATREHLDAVARFGYSEVHRRSFRPRPCLIGGAVTPEPAISPAIPSSWRRPGPAIARRAETAEKLVRQGKIEAPSGYLRG